MDGDAKEVAELAVKAAARPVKKASKPKAKKPAAKKKKKAAKPKRKPAPKKASKPKAKKPAKAKKKASKPKAASAPIVRSERMDIRLSKKEKARLMAKAKATRRTITSIVQELIENLK